ncbi:MAG: DUF58 domain-containing protein [Epsilonproteobacteria bacterium]|nr:DUF58 domain-containing protein [Campylobacterota bacterium]
MLNDDIRHKVKKIKIHTKRLMQSSLTGDYLSAFKGSGLEFDQLREYQFGDDVRFIDWNSSAKMNKIMIKQFTEERDRTIILAIDLSTSSHFSSQQDLKKDLIAQVAATIAFVASNNKDKVGAVFFSDHIEHWIAPARGNSHVGKIIENIFSLQPKSKQTNLQEALRFLIRLKKRNAVVFMLSDFIDELDSYKKLLNIVRYEYDFIAMRILDECEKALPNVGKLQVQDPETGGTYHIDTSLKQLNTFLQKRLIEQKKVFERCKIDMLDLHIGRSFIHVLVNFFHQRIRRQI